MHTINIWLKTLFVIGRYTFEGTTAFKRSLARLRGGLRRLNVRDPDEYDEQEYTEAATAVFESAQVIATQSRYRKSHSARDGPGHDRRRNDLQQEVGCMKDDCAVSQRLLIYGRQSHSDSCW